MILKIISVNSIKLKPPIYEKQKIKILFYWLDFTSVYSTKCGWKYIQYQ